MAASVLCVTFPDAQILDITGPLQILSAVNDFRRERAYDIRLVARRKGALVTSSGLSLQVAASFDDIDVTQLKKLDTLMVVGGFGVEKAVADIKLLAFVRRAARHARRVVSICSGALILAAAGVITTERVATHWHRVAELRERYPTLKVDADAIFVRDGRFWTSAGVTAGIDLALALVQEDWGHPLAVQIARYHVMFTIRPGGQAQFSTHLQAQAAEGSRLGPLLKWIADNVGHRLNVPALAERAGMTERTLMRVFRQELATTPAAFLETARLDAARRLLEQTRQPLELVARRAGYGHVERLRRSFHRSLGVSPSDYRQRFSVSTRTVSRAAARPTTTGDVS